MFDMILKQGLEYVLSDKETFDETSRFDLLQKIIGIKSSIIL